MRCWLLSLCLMVTVLLMPLHVSAASTASASALSSEARDRCLSKIMQAGGGDLSRLQPNQIAEACQSFPLSDDVFVQTLGAMIGPDMLIVLDAYSAISGEAHGFDEGSPLFTAAAPYQSIMKAANYFFLSLFLGGLVLSVFAQMLRWSKGDKKMSVAEWTGRHGSNYSVSLMLSLPVIGWMTPIQAFALVVILLLGFVAKWVVTYLFLASFFGGTAVALQDEVKEEIQVDFGRAVMLQNCDIHRREVLVKEIQSHLGSRAKKDLESNGLYQCLTSGAGGVASTQRLPDPSALSVSFAYTPASLAQTDFCVNSHRADLQSWGVDAPESCGVIQFTLPNNTTANSSVQRAIALYASPSVIQSQRALALKVNEFECRAGGRVPDHSGQVVSSCMNAQPSGNGYRYLYVINKVTGEEELAYFNMPLSDVSRAEFASSVKKELVNLNQSVSSNVPAILAHLSDLLAPYPDEGEIPEALQKRRDALSAKLKERFSETSALGFSREDAEFVVSNIQRGPWTASSLFYGSLADGVGEKGIVSSLEQVYSVPAYATEGVFNTDLVSIQNMKTVTANNKIDRFTEDLPGWGLIIPRTGLYLDYVNCWHTQVDCESPPLNPFTYLGTRGAQLIDEASIRYLAGSFIHRIARMMVGSSRQEYSRFMILDTLGQFQLLYLVLGAILALIIPLLPLLKLLAMMVNWVYDVCREFLSIQIKIALSPLGEHGDKMISDDVRQSLNRLFGLGLYFLFVILGVSIMFLMYSFLFSLNVFFVGSLSSVVSWGGQLSALDSLVINTVMDCVIVFLLLYQVYKCTPYIEKIPRAMMEYFEINITESDSMVEKVFEYAKGHIAPGVANFIHNSGSGFDRIIDTFKR